MAVVVLAVLFLAYVLVREYVVWKEREQAAQDRAYLLQRIQAPQEVVNKELQEALPPGAPSAPIFTDEDAWVALTGLKPKAEE